MDKYPDYKNNNDNLKRGQGKINFLESYFSDDKGIMNKLGFVSYHQEIDLDKTDESSAGRLINLGDVYYLGKPMKQDYYKAFNYYLQAMEYYYQAIELNNIEAILKVAKMYYDGNIVKEDYY